MHRIIWLVAFLMLAPTNGTAQTASDSGPLPLEELVRQLKVALLQVAVPPPRPESVRASRIARTAVAVIREPAGAALRVALSARERASLHDAVGGPRREPQRQNMVRNVERHLRRKALENLVDLVRHRKSVVFVHLLSRESSTQSHALLTIVR